MKKIVIITCFMLSLISVSGGSFASSLASLENHGDSGKIEYVKNAIYQLQNQVKPGLPDYFSSKEETLEFGGFATCRQYAELLKHMLEKRGIGSTVVWMLSAKGGSHNGLEVLLSNSRKILVDPMAGVIYSNSLMEIIINSKLALNSNILNTPNKFPILTDPEYFKNISNFGYDDIKVPGGLIKASLYDDNENEDKECRNSICKFSIKPRKAIESDKFYSESKIYYLEASNLDSKFYVEGVEYIYSGFLIVRNKNKLINLEVKSEYPVKFNLLALVDPFSYFRPKKDMLHPFAAVIAIKGIDFDMSNIKITCGDDKSLRYSTRKDLKKDFILIPNGKSSWSDVILDKNISFRSAIFGLPSNEPRMIIRLKGKDQSEACTLMTKYRSNSGADFSVYSTKDGSLTKKIVVPPCPEFCSREFEFIYPD